MQVQSLLEENTAQLAQTDLQNASLRYKLMTAHGQMNVMGQRAAADGRAKTEAMLELVAEKKRTATLNSMVDTLTKDMAALKADLKEANGSVERNRDRVREMNKALAGQRTPKAKHKRPATSEPGQI